MTKYYYHGGQRVAQRRRTPLGADVVTYLHPDHLGSTSLATDGEGAVVARRRYYPYGAERWRAGERVTDFGYTGQRDVVGTGLMYYKARYYYPALGRFVSADTIVPEPGNPQALNRYAYVKNNPLVHVDPDGHVAIVATAAIGAGVGALIGAGAYYLSLDNPQSDFRWDECLLVAGTGAVAGGLIGTGVGALAGAKLMSGGLMAASTAAVHTGAGVGMGMQGGSTLYQNHKAGEDFHAAKFMINSSNSHYDF